MSNACCSWLSFNATHFLLHTTVPAGDLRRDLHMKIIVGKGTNRVWLSGFHSWPFPAFALVLFTFLVYLYSSLSFLCLVCLFHPFSSLFQIFQRLLLFDILFPVRSLRFSIAPAIAPQLYATCDPDIETV